LVLHNKTLRLVELRAKLLRLGVLRPQALLVSLEFLLESPSRAYDKTQSTHACCCCESPLGNNILNAF
jgi:hypothetical protein